MSISKMLIQKNLEDKILFLLKNLKPEERTLIGLIKTMNPLLINKIYEIEEMVFDEENFENLKEFYKHKKSLKEPISNDLRSMKSIVSEKLEELEKKGLISSIKLSVLDFEEDYIWSLNDKQGKYEMKIMNISQEAYELLNVRTYKEMDKIVEKELKIKDGIHWDDECDYSSITSDRFWNQELFREARDSWNFHYRTDIYSIIESNSEKLIKVSLKEIEKRKEEQTSTAMSILIGELFLESFKNHLNKIEKKLEELKKEV